MKIKLKESISGLEFSYKPGDEVTIDDAEGARWVKADIAELVDPDAQPVEIPERAADTNVESATVTSEAATGPAAETAQAPAAPAKPAKAPKAAKAK